MGFRSTICSTHYDYELPQWIKVKYQSLILFPSGTLAVSKCEAKFYNSDFFKDYQKALIEVDFDFTLDTSISVLGEDGYISRVNIYKKEIIILQLGFRNEGDESKTVWYQ